MSIPLPAATSAAPALRGRILVVEDDPEAAYYFRHVLTRRGHFFVTHTADPALALALAATKPWDLVLIDLDLPVMSGLNLLAKLRRAIPRLPVIVVTGSALDVDPSFAPGVSQADAIITKPVRVDSLLSVVTLLSHATSAP